MSANAATSPDENALFYNLCLLGIPTQAGKNGIELTRQSFRKPNPRSLELVLYYLYAAICGEAKASKDFRGMCPIPDKSQSKEFNQRVTDWFRELKEKHHLESIGSMTASQVRSATGHRAVSALLELSTLALLLEYQRLSPESAQAWNFKSPPEKDPKFLPELAHVLPSLGAVAIKTQAQQFTALMQKAAAAQEVYEGCAQDFKDQFYHLRSQCQQLQYSMAPEDAALMEEHIQRQAIQPGTFSPLAPLLAGSVEPSLSVQHASDTMAHLEEHLQQYDALGDLMHSTVGSAVHPHAVDGGKLAALAATGASASLSADGTLIRPHLGDQQAAASAAAAVAAGGAAGLGGQPAAGADVDVGEMLEQWVSSLEQCCPLVEALAGQHGQGVSPLAAPSYVSSSHAALLGTQLKARKAAVDSLTTMRAALQAQHFSTDRLLQEMPARVAAAMSAPKPGSTTTSTNNSTSSSTPLAKGTPHQPSSTAATDSSRAGKPAYGPSAVLGPIVHGLPPTPVMAAQQAKRGGLGAGMGIGFWMGGNDGLLGPSSGADGVRPFAQQQQGGGCRQEAQDGTVHHQRFATPKTPSMFGGSGHERRDGRSALQSGEQLELQQNRKQRESGGRMLVHDGIETQGPLSQPAQPPLPSTGAQPRDSGAEIQGSQTHDLGLLDLDNDDDFGVDGTTQVLGFGRGGGGSGNWSIGEMSAMKGPQQGSRGEAVRKLQGPDPDLDPGMTPVRFFR